MFEKFITSPAKPNALNKFLFFVYTKALGWKMSESVPPGSYLYITEHTSNWDSLQGFFYYHFHNDNVYFVVAEEKTKYIPKNILRRFHIIGIPRNNEGLKHIVDELKLTGGSLYIAPEGTRSKTDGWKPGFHVLAKKFDVPIVVVSLDYKRKEHQTLGIVTPGDTVEETIERCKQLLTQKPRDIQCHPEKASPIALSPKYKK